MCKHNSPRGHAKRIMFVVWLLDPFAYDAHTGQSVPEAAGPPDLRNQATSRDPFEEGETDGRLKEEARAPPDQSTEWCGPEQNMASWRVDSTEWCRAHQEGLEQNHLSLWRASEMSGSECGSAVGFQQQTLLSPRNKTMFCFLCGSVAPIVLFVLSRSISCFSIYLFEGNKRSCSMSCR